MDHNERVLLYFAAAESVLIFLSLTLVITKRRRTR